jgi:hypothetical protein
MTNIVEKRNYFSAGSIAGIAILPCFAMLMGCEKDPTVWKKDIPSPNGAWVATARTEQWGGFGSARVQTTVSIRKLDGTVNHGKPFDVLSYPGGGNIANTYVLSNANADTNLRVAWLTPTRHHITHLNPIKPDLEVIRLSDVDISFQ